MANNFTFRVVDSNDLISAAVEAEITRCAQYVISLVSQHLSWLGTMNFEVVIRPASELTWSNADGLLPSIVQTSWNGYGWVNDTLVECLTGVDRNPAAPDAGCTIYLAADGTIKNYGAPVWFDPAPAFGKDPGVPAGTHDFIGIYTHEIFHSLGFIGYTQQWKGRITTSGDRDYFVGPTATQLFGGPIVFQAGSDHYGFTADPAVPISRGLMFQWGNYSGNRLDIGRIDLAMLADLGHSVKSYDGLPLFELIDTATDLDGTAGADRLYGDYHSNRIAAFDGADIVEGGAGSDWVEGGAGDDDLRGDSGDDTLAGGDGDDTIDGGTGADSMSGGRGSDIFWVDDAGDRVEEFAGQGVDWVYTTLASYTLPDHFENLDGRKDAHTLTGNSVNNAVVGTMRANVLNGEGGDDLLIGEFASDVLNGGEGRDILIGGLVDAPDFIVNGSFETQDGSNATRAFILEAPASDGISAFRASAALHGWSSATGQPIELHTALSNNGFNIGRGAAAVDMESAGGNQIIYQDIAGLAAGARLLLNFGAALPAGGGSAILEVYWNGALVGTVAPTSTAMTKFSFVVTAAGGSNRLEFREIGAGGDGRGTVLDCVELRTFMTYTDTAADVLNGGAGDDALLGDGGDDSLNGGSGNDRLSGGGGADTADGGLGNDEVDGGAGDDLLRMDQGGTDTALGSAGKDAIIFGSTLTGADIVDGGSEVDQLSIQGDYWGAKKLTLGNVTNVEQIILLAGSNTAFGGPGTGFHSYELTTQDLNVAAGGLLQVDANQLRAGESFTFDGSAETDGAFFIWGGKGVDLITTGAGNDGFLFRGSGNWGSSDVVNAGAGIDQVGIRGNYVGTGAIVMGANQLASVEQLVLMSGSDIRFGRLTAPTSYDITMNDANVASGQRMTVDAASLREGETLTFNASAELDGAYTVFGGRSADTITGGAGADVLRGARGGDTLTGGGGADKFVYRSASESTGVNFDTLVDLSSVDRIDLPTSVSSFAQSVTTGRLDNATFDADLATALDGVLEANQAVLFTASSGDHVGKRFLIVDGNGDGAYTEGTDYVFALGATATIDTSSTAVFV